MKTLYYTAVSLDGFIADENHSLAWLFQFPDEDDSSYPDFINGIGAIVMGSSTYEWLLKNHIYADPAQPKPWPYAQPTWIFTSRSLTPLPGADIRFVKGDVAPVFAEIQRDVWAGKNLWIAGGGAIAAQFHAARVLDELILTVAPVLLAKGAPLFGGRIITPPLKTISVAAKKGGFVEICLAVQRPVQT